MGLLDKFRKGGGGFLNNVDGLVTDLRFTTEPDFGGEAKARKEGESTPLWAVLTVRVDGDEKGDQATHLYAGAADEFVISEDGRSLTPAVDGAMLWGGTAFLQFYESLVKGDETIDVDAEEDGTLNFSAVVGVRARFIQVKDVEAMARAAKKAGASKGKINAQGQRKGKDGKFYDQRALQVSEVYSTGNEVDAAEEAPKAKGATRPTTKTTSPSKGAVAAKPVAAKAAKVVANAVGDFAEVVLLDILGGAKNNTIKKSELNLAVTRKLVKDDRREDVRKYLFEDANLAAIETAGKIVLDGTGSAQTITQVAV
jgi:hypothetical protein